MDTLKKRALMERHHSNGYSLANRQSYNSDTLQAKISSCRSQLGEDPGDLATRVSLAWYLLVQAISYKREQELWSQLTGRAERLDEKLSAALNEIRREMARTTSDHRRTLKESLFQAATVLQLSVDARERDQAARIRELAELFGSEQAVTEADAEAERILARVARAICAEKREKTRISSHRRDEDDDDLDDF